MQLIYLCVLVTILGCGSRTTIVVTTAPQTIEVPFSTNGASTWLHATIDSDTGYVAIQDNRLSILSSRGQEHVVSQSLELPRLRGKRVTVIVHPTFLSRDPDAFTEMKLAFESPGPAIDAWDSAAASRTNGDRTELRAAVDVPADAASLRIELHVNGEAKVSIDPPRLLVSEFPRRPDETLSDTTTEALRTLAKLVAYLRFFHPSDQVASADWLAVEADAVNRVLAASTEAEVRAIYDRIVSAVAPTALIYEGSKPPPSFSQPPRGGGTRLARWVRIGNGERGTPYLAFRTAIKEPRSVGILVAKTTPSQGCKHVTARLASISSEGTPELSLRFAFRRGSRTLSAVTRSISAEGAAEADVPEDTAVIMFGIQLQGTGTVEVSSLLLQCEGRTLTAFTFGPELEFSGVGFHLYSVSPVHNCQGCFTISRRPEMSFDSHEDEPDFELGGRLRLRMPLALWTDGTRTFPEVTSRALAPATLPRDDVASRIASVIDVWMTLRWHYPYSENQKVDWERILKEGLLGSARAHSSDDLLTVLSHLVSEIHDAHASVYRPSLDDGVLPFVFWRIDSTILILRGLGAYSSVFPRGSILESLDGVPSGTLIRQLTSTISSATPGWMDAYLAFSLGEGRPGVMASIRARLPDGQTTTIQVPRVSRSQYVTQKQLERPKSGSEIQPSVVYVDAAKLEWMNWQELLPKLSTARGVVYDLRGGAPPAAFQILAHYIDSEIRSPFWDIPVVHPTRKMYERSQLSIYPLAPRLSAKLAFLVDGGTASSGETILQYARAARVGIVVGEPTAGTNGNVSSFESVNRFMVRFTGMKVVNQDNSEFHGKGITPDVIAHPTAAGLRAGRDELLEAAIEAVRPH